MKYIQVNKEQYSKFLKNLDEKYIYVPNMLENRTDIVEVTNITNRIGTRFIGEYGNPDTYEIREDFHIRSLK